MIGVVEVTPKKPNAPRASLNDVESIRVEPLKTSAVNNPARDSPFETAANTFALMAVTPGVKLSTRASPNQLVPIAV